MIKPESNQGGEDKQPNEKVYWAAHHTLRLLTGVTRTRVAGREHVEAINNTDRGSVMVGSHTSMWDVVDLAAAGFTRPIRFLGKDSLLSHPVLGLPIRVIAPHAKVIFLNREDRASRYGAARAALDAVNDGDLVNFFPEGTRSKSDDPRHVGDFRYGAARTALMAEGVTPVLPYGVGFRSGWKFSSSPIRSAIVAGEPFYMAEDPHAADVEEFSDLLQRTVTELKSHAVDLAHSRE